MFKILNEYRALLFAFLIILVVNVIAYVSFQKITTVSNNISITLKNETPASLVAKQVMVELRTAENYARAYYLTDDKESLKNYFKTTYNLNELLVQLNTYKLEEDNKLIDSITNYSRLLVRKLKSQSYLNDPKRIVGELDDLSQTIDLLYEQPISEAVEIKEPIKQDTIKKKDGFLKRIFSRKKKNKDTLITANTVVPIEIKKSANVKGELKVAVTSAKHSQSKIITENRKSEYELSKVVYTYREKLNSLIELLRLHEDSQKIANTKVANDELRKLKVFTLTSTAVLSIFLLALIYFIYVYNKKKIQYVSMLDRAKTEAENLAMAKENFLNSMSHEIKTPLNAIQGFSELLSNSNMNDEQIKQVNIIKNSSTYLSKLINNILSNARLNSGKINLNLVEVNIKNEINEIYNILQQQALNKGIELKLETKHFTANAILIDIEKLKQILFNLIGNAIKFTATGSVVFEVSDKNEEVPSMFIEIKDTGIGIKEETLPHLFQEFEQGGEQTQAKFGGTGLGLVITKKTVMQLGGNISIKSKINEGTTVSILIPYQAAGKHATLSKSENTIELDFIEHKKFLVVDDEEYNRLLLRAILSKYNTTIVEAKNGQEALIAVENETFDLIIMDINMPELNGIETTLEIRKHNTKVPILGATAVINEEKIARATKAGMDDIIFKPFSKAELSIKLEQIFKPKKSKGIAQTIVQPVKEQSINLNALNESTQGDETFRKELIAVFHKSLNESVVAINKLFAENNYDLISERAHKIIPSCKHFETHRLLKALKYIEKINNSSALDRAIYKHNIAIINEEVELINEALKPLLS